MAVLPLQARFLRIPVVFRRLSSLHDSDGVSGWPCLYASSLVPLDDSLSVWVEMGGDDTHGSQDAC